MDSAENSCGRVPRTITILGATWTLTSISIITVAVRLYTRKWQRVMGADDWIMAAAAALNIIYQALLHIACLRGMGKTATDSTPQEIVDVRKWALVSAAFTNIISVLARISISILLIRAFETKRWLHWFLGVSSSLMAVIGVTATILLFNQSRPVESIWDYRIKGSPQYDPRIQGGLSLTLQVMLTLSDITFVLFPMLIVWRLNMSLHRKIGIGLLLGLSIIAFATALTKVVVIIMNKAKPSPPFNNDSSCFNGLWNIVSGAEQSLVITMGCIPALGQAAKSAFCKLSGAGSRIAGVVCARSPGRRHSSESTSMWLGGFSKPPTKNMVLGSVPRMQKRGEGASNVSAVALSTMQESDGCSSRAGLPRGDGAMVNAIPHRPREEL